MAHHYGRDVDAAYIRKVLLYDDSGNNASQISTPEVATPPGAVYHKPIILLLRTKLVFIFQQVH